MPALGFISMPGGGEWLVIGFVGLLLFGKRLPEVARSLGQSVTEFKKGLTQFEQEHNRPSYETSNASSAVSSTHSEEIHPAEFSPSPQLPAGHAEPLEQAAEPSLAVEQSVERP